MTSEIARKQEPQWATDKGGACAGGAGADRLLLRVDQVAEVLAISRRSVWRLSSTGQLPRPVRLPGTRAVRWRRADLERFVEELG